MSNTNSLKELSNVIDKRGLNTVIGELEEVFNEDERIFKEVEGEWASVKESGLLPDDFTPELKHHIRENMIGALNVTQSHYKELYKIMANIVILLEREVYVRYDGPLKNVTTMMETMDQTYRDIDFLRPEMEDYIQERPNTKKERASIATSVDEVSTLLDKIDRATVTEEKIIPIQTGIYDVQKTLERIRPNVSQQYYDSTSEKLSRLLYRVGDIQSTIQMRNVPPGPAYSAPFSSYSRSTFRSAAAPSPFARPKAEPPREKARAEPPREKAREQTEEEKEDLEKERCRSILSEYGILTMGKLNKKKFLQEFSREYHPDKSGTGVRVGEDDETKAEKATIFQTVSSCYRSHQWGGQKKKRMTKRRPHRKAKTQKTQKTQKK